ncbi:MAG: FAD-dependent oxidoreductase [archaeon]|nr:MAG: FAD-dependent oxidoreductase [archaeon]
MGVYDVIVLGAGPAGLSAAVYATRYNLKLLVIGKGPALMSEAPEVCNYLGYPSISGTDMDNAFREHVEKLGAEIRQETLQSLDKDGDIFVVKTDQGEYRSKTVIYAMGGTKRKMGLPEEQKFMGRGVSYCATCDAAFFRGKTVAVTGGSNSAAMAALVLSDVAEKVYIVYRRDKMRAFPSFMKKIEQKENIEIIHNSLIKEIKGDKLVEGMVIENTETGEKKEIEVNGIFVEFGQAPNSGPARELGAETLENGRIKVNEDMTTSVRGLLAAGDVTSGSDKFDQVVTAAAEGAIAARSAYKIITEVD